MGCILIMKNIINITTRIYTVSTYDKYIGSTGRYVKNSDVYRNKFGSIQVWQAEVGYTDPKYVCEFRIQVKDKLHIRRFDNYKCLNNRQLSVYAGKFQKELFNVLEITESF